MGYGGAFRGGIASLARLIEEHGRALEYDLITKTNYTLADLGEALPYASLLSFINYLPADSAIRRAQQPDIAPWLDGQKTAVVLADLYDLVGSLAYMFASVHHGKGSKPKKPKPYPRPWIKDPARKLGSGAMPVSEFEEWWKGGTWQTE